MRYKSIREMVVVEMRQANEKIREWIRIVGSSWVSCVKLWKAASCAVSLVLACWWCLQLLLKCLGGDAYLDVCFGWCSKMTMNRLCDGEGHSQLKPLHTCTPTLTLARFAGLLADLESALLKA